MNMTPLKNGNVWFFDITYKSVQYKVVEVTEEGVINLYVKHPLDDNIPSMSFQITATPK